MTGCETQKKKMNDVKGNLAGDFMLRSPKNNVANEKNWIKSKRSLKSSTWRMIVYTPYINL